MITFNKKHIKCVAKWFIIIGLLNNLLLCSFVAWADEIPPDAITIWLIALSIGHDRGPVCLEQRNKWDYNFSFDGNSPIICENTANPLLRDQLLSENRELGEPNWTRIVTQWPVMDALDRFAFATKTKIKIRSECNTFAWLLFSTNKNIDQLFEDNMIREDFIFRFEDRVIYIPPLRQRPADIPAITRYLWDGLSPSKILRITKGQLNHILKANFSLKEKTALELILTNAELSSKEELIDIIQNTTGKSINISGIDDLSMSGYRKLGAGGIELICSLATQWKGNIRVLKSLLSLCAYTFKSPDEEERSISLKEFLERMMHRGTEYYHWMGFIVASSDNAPAEEVYMDKTSRKVLSMNNLNRNKRIGDVLTLEGIKRFKMILKRNSTPRDRRKIVCLQQIICYVAEEGEIDTKRARLLLSCSNGSLSNYFNILTGDDKSYNADAVKMLYKFCGKKGNYSKYIPLEGIFKPRKCEGIQSYNIL